MTSAETIAQIKDIVVILFLAFASIVVIIASILGVRLYWRVGRFMDRIEKVAGQLESTLYGVAIAGKVLRPVASGLGLLGVAQGIGRLFGVGRTDPDDKAD